MNTTMQTIRRYAREGLDQPRVQATALALIANLADDAIEQKQPGVLTCGVCGLGYYPTATPHVCAPGGGVMPVEPKTDGDWYYAETAYGAEVEAGRFTLKAHWSGLAETDDIQATMRQVVADHRLAGLVSGLVAALRKLDELDWVVGYELTEVNMRILQEALDLTGAALAAARKAGVEDE